MSISPQSLSLRTVFMRMDLKGGRPCFVFHSFWCLLREWTFLWYCFPNIDKNGSLYNVAASRLTLRAEVKTVFYIYIFSKCFPWNPVVSLEVVRREEIKIFYMLYHVLENVLHPLCLNFHSRYALCVPLLSPGVLWR